jgi:hypothetical protein
MEHYMSKHVRRTHRIIVNAPIEKTFMFFTPAGEELWAEGWSPCYIHPPCGTTSRGMVFTTGEGESFTIWQLLDFDRVHYRSHYVRTTPLLRAGQVVVDCSPVSDRSTAVDVTYDMVALTVAGERSLVAFAPDSYVGMIESWSRRIEQRIGQLVSAAIR